MNERGEELKAESAAVNTNLPLTADPAIAPSENPAEVTTGQLPTPTSELSKLESPEADPRSDGEGAHLDGKKSKAANRDAAEVTATALATAETPTEAQRPHKPSPSQSAPPDRKSNVHGRPGESDDSTLNGNSMSEDVDVQVQADQLQQANETYPYAGPPNGSRGSVQFESGSGLGATAATVVVTLIAGSILLSLRRFL